MTSKALGEIGAVGGPRCCKRDSYLSILAAIDFVKEHLKIEMEKPEIVCGHSAPNNQLQWSDLDGETLMLVKRGNSLILFTII